MARNTSVFNKNIVLGVCLLTAICCKLLLQYHFFSFDGDKRLQAIAAKSFFEGNGLRIPAVYGHDLTTLVYEPMLAWPPGYSFLILPLYALQKNIIESTFLADVIATLLFFLFYFLILKKLRFPVVLNCLLLLFNGVYLSQNLVYSAPTDLLSLSFLLAALYYFLLLVEQNHYTLIKSIAVAVLCFLPSLFRYLYLPVAFVIPVLLCWLGYTTKNKAQLKSGAVALLSTAVLSAAMLYHLKTATGITGNNPSMEGASFGLYFSHIQYMHPFLISGIINLDFIVQQVSKFTGYTYQTLLHFINQAHYILLLLAAVFLGLFIKRSKPLGKQTTKELFYSAGLGICFIILGGLFFLSLTTKLVVDPINHTVWTYIQEERYYRFAAVFLPLFMFNYLKESREKTGAKFKTAMYYALLFLIAFETLHGLYFVGRRVVPGNKAESQDLFEDTYQSFLKAFIDANKTSGNEVVLGGTINTYFWYARAYHIKPLLHTEDINQPLYAEKPTVLLIGLHEAALPRFQPFLAKKGLKEELKKGDTHFYSIYFKSHESK